MTREERELEQLRALMQARAELRGRPGARELNQRARQVELLERQAMSRDELLRALGGDRAAARRAVEALPLELERILAEPGKSPQWRRRKWQRTLAETAAAVEEAHARAEKRGRKGHSAVMRSPWSYVQQEDLDDLLPDGWGEQFNTPELELHARKHDLPPKGIALLVLLTWCSRFRDPSRDFRGRGAGAQFSLEWLGSKLGCWASWVKVCINRLDPHASWRRELAAVRRENARRKRDHRRPRKEPEKPSGTVYIERHRRLKRYALVKQRDGGRAAAWIDKNGKPRFFCDVRGVLYTTDAGRALLGKPTESPAPGIPGEPASGAGAELARRLIPVALLLEKRLEKSTDALPPSGAG